MLLSDLATHKNDFLSSSLSLNDAIAQMGKEGISHVVLLENDIAVGILTRAPCKSPLQMIEKSA